MDRRRRPAGRPASRRRFADTAPPEKGYSAVYLWDILLHSIMGNVIRIDGERMFM
jgi:hypothetical protein